MPLWIVNAINSKTFLQSLERHIKGATRTRIAKSNLINMKIGVPPLAEQQKFAAVVEQMESVRARQLAAQTDADALFAALQARAFAGEL